MPWRTVARAVTFDRLGVVIALLAFPTVLLPYLGILASALLIGLVNLSISAVVAWRFRAIAPSADPPCLSVLWWDWRLRHSSPGPRRFWTFGGAALSGTRPALRQSERGFVMMNSFRGDVRLYVNGRLQFSF